MFEAEIIHANDMLGRLEAEAKLPLFDRELLPDYKRVPVAEATAWEEDVEQKIARLKDNDLRRRLQLVAEERRRQLDASEGDELSRYINYVHGVLRLLRQIEQQLSIVAPIVEHAVPANSPTNPRKTTQMHYDVFISHASEDKEVFVRPLYEALRRRRISAWFDQATLELGDSLRRKIDDGLTSCRFGVVILSPNFLAKEWPQRELDALVARETASGEKAILPVLHNLTIPELAKRSPLLADRLCANSSAGVDAVADAVAGVFNRARPDA